MKIQQDLLTYYGGHREEGNKVSEIEASGWNDSFGFEHVSFNVRRYRRTLFTIHVEIWNEYLGEIIN